MLAPCPSAIPAPPLLLGSTSHLRFLLRPHSPNPNTPTYPAERTSQKQILGAVGPLPVLVREGLWCSSVRSEAGRRVLTPRPGHSWGCWDLLCAGVSFLVLASRKHLNGECDGPSILIPVQTQLSFPGLSSRSQETTKALGAELPLLPLGAEYPKKSLTPQIPLWGQGGGEFHTEPLRHSWANAQNLPC